jgi:two-component system CheB/CheR fusion protein
MDLQGRITSWSPGAELIFGFAESEVLGQSGEIIFTPEDKAKGVPAEEMRSAREEGRAADERWHQRRDGTRIFCSGVMTPLHDDELKGYVKIARDLTGRQQLAAAHEELLGFEREARTAVEAANRMKDEFLAILSHELKHPLNLMRLSTDILNRAAETERLPVVRRAAETISQSVSVQGKLIDDLLDFSRLHTGKLSLNRRPIALAPVIAGALEMMRVDATDKQIELELALPGQQDDLLIVEADTVRVEQVVWNLLSNAIKFTQPGGRVRVALGREGAEAKLSVEDTGQGIAPDFLPHVFDMFRQANAGPTKQYGGLGIGLALVRQLVELHGGRVAAESAGIGKGARFTVWLPLYNESSASGPAASSQAADSELKGLRLLVVDDDPGTAEMMRTLLQMEGATVTTATSAAAALRLTEAADFDLLLSDVAMPVMDGYQLIQELRKRSRNAGIPAIALTGFSRTEDIQRAFAAGFSAYLKKPIEFDALIQTVRATVK